jgi:hypothetical protein
MSSIEIKPPPSPRLELSKLWRSIYMFYFLAVDSKSDWSSGRRVALLKLLFIVVELASVDLSDFYIEEISSLFEKRSQIKLSKSTSLLKP